MYSKLLKIDDIDNVINCGFRSDYNWDDIEVDYDVWAQVRARTLFTRTNE